MLRAVWSSFIDERTCRFCRWADGRYFDPKSGGETVPAHSHCRCSIDYYYEEDLIADGTSSDLEFDSWGDGPPDEVLPIGKR